MKSLAHSYVWWPSLDGDIERIVHLCMPCQTRHNAPAVAPLHPWEWPSRPWARLHIDYAGPFFGKMFFVLVDAYSKWLEVKTLLAASAKTTIRCLQDIFATHGLPERIVSDNSSVFTRDEFRFFLKENGIPHTTIVCRIIQRAMALPSELCSLLNSQCAKVLVALWKQLWLRFYSRIASLHMRPRHRPQQSCYFNVVHGLD